MVNSPTVRATSASSGAGKKELDEPVNQALGRSCGGFTTESHMLCDANGVLLRSHISSGQASDISYAQTLLDDVCITTNKRGRPRKHCRWLLAEKDYSAAPRRYCDRYRMQSVIPLHAMKREPYPGLRRLFDRSGVGKVGQDYNIESRFNTGLTAELPLFPLFRPLK